jgi:hypothetical protein
MIKTLAAYTWAVLVAYFLAVIFATQFVAASLIGMGIEVSLAQRLEMSFKDVIGMTGMFLPLVAVGFLIALGAAGILSRRNPLKRTFLFTLAGALAMIAIHLGLKFAFDINLVAVARTLIGLFTQAIAGAVGGYCFTRIKRMPA